MKHVKVGNALYNYYNFEDMIKKRYNPRSSSTLPEDDVDDDTFLNPAAKSPRPISSYANSTGFPSDSPIKSTFQQRYDSLEDQKTQLLNRKKEIECRTLESTQRSLSLLRDSEEVGIATAEELARQREQLENTDARLNEINENLHSSSKHIQGISSIFGSIKNYWTSRKSSEDKDRTAVKSSPRSVSVDATPQSRHKLKNALERASTNIDVDDHPGMRIRGISTSHSKSSTDSGDFQDALDRNLDEMVGSIARLKGLAEGLGQELDSQNQLVEDVISKTEKADINIEKQNKDIKRLLRK